MKATVIASVYSPIPLASTVHPAKTAISSHCIPAHKIYIRKISAAVPRNRSGPARIIAMASSANEAAPSGRHAFLHDFCMCIPYGMIVAAGGLLSAVWFGLPGLYVAAAGIAEVVLSARSLRAWKKRQSSTIYTLLEAAVASGVAYAAWNAVRQGTAKWASMLLLGLSVSASLFFLYNVAAGGNPPKEEGSTDDGDKVEPLEEKEE